MSASFYDRVTIANELTTPLLAAGQLNIVLPCPMTDHILSYLKGLNCLSSDPNTGNYSRVMQESMGLNGSSVSKINLDGRDPTLYTYSPDSTKRAHGLLRHSACRQLRTLIQFTYIALCWR